MSLFRLLLITNRYPAHRDDSASPFVADFVDGLRRNRIDCTVLTPYHHADHYDSDDGVIRFNWGEENQTIGSLPLYKPSSWFKIAAYFRKGNFEADRQHNLKNFDFCLALWAAPSGLIAHRLNRKYGLPYAVWCLGSDIHTYARIPIVGNKILESLTASDRVYSDGHELGRIAERLSGCKYHYLPSLRRVQWRPDGKVQKERLLICPGRFNSWSLYFIGEGSSRSALQKKIEAHDLTSRVKTLGFLKSDEMFRLIGKSAGVVIPTRNDSLPLTFGEAMQLKRPVIVTDIGDLKYFTEKYGVGLVVPPSSPNHLADAMTSFITEKKEYKDGFDDCVKELDINLAADRFVEWLKNHLAHQSETREKVLC